MVYLGFLISLIIAQVFGGGKVVKGTPGRCVRSVTGSAGGELILGWWKSALFFKSSLFERSEFGLLENGFSRIPAA